MNKKDKKVAFDAFEKCLQQKGFFPIPEKSRKEDRNSSNNLQEQFERDNELKFQEYMRKVLYNDLNL